MPTSSSERRARDLERLTPPDAVASRCRRSSDHRHPAGGSAQPRRGDRRGHGRRAKRARVATRSRVSASPARAGENGLPGDPHLRRGLSVKPCRGDSPNVRPRRNGRDRWRPGVDPLRPPARGASVSETSAHWDSVYSRKDPTEVSWFEPSPRASLELIEAMELDRGRAGGRCRRRRLPPCRRAAYAAGFKT